MQRCFQARRADVGAAALTVQRMAPQTMRGQSILAPGQLGARQKQPVTAETAAPATAKAALAASAAAAALAARMCRGEQRERRHSWRHPSRHDHPACEKIRERRLARQCADESKCRTTRPVFRARVGATLCQQSHAAKMSSRCSNHEGGPSILWKRQVERLCTAMQRRSARTVSTVSFNAPLSSSMRTHSTWPFQTARESGVLPVCADNGAQQLGNACDCTARGRHSVTRHNRTPGPAPPYWRRDPRAARGSRAVRTSLRMTWAWRPSERLEGTCAREQRGQRKAGAPQHTYALGDFLCGTAQQQLPHAVCVSVPDAEHQRRLARLRQRVRERASSAACRPGMARLAQRLHVCSRLEQQPSAVEVTLARGE